MAITFKDAEQTARLCPHGRHLQRISACLDASTRTCRHGLKKALRLGGPGGPGGPGQRFASQHWPLKSHHRVCARWPFKPRRLAVASDSAPRISSIQGATAFALPKNYDLPAHGRELCTDSTAQQQAILLLACLRTHIYLTVAALCPWRATAAQLVQGGVSLPG